MFKISLVQGAFPQVLVPFLAAIQDGEPSFAFQVPNHAVFA